MWGMVKERFLWGNSRCIFCSSGKFMKMVKLL